MGINRSLSLLGLGALLVVSFQNCQVQPKFDVSQKTASEGNGDSYGGKPEILDRTDSTCTELDRQGRPLPSAQIFVYRSSGQVAMVRENCQDIQPHLLAPADFSFATDGSKDVIVDGHLFKPTAVQSALDVIAAACPAGLTEKNVTRVNLVPAELDMTDLNTWWNHVGITSTFASVIGSIPSFKIERTDSSLLEYWRRAHYEGMIKPSTRYAFSFLAKPGSVNDVFVGISDNANANTAKISLIADASTGAVTVPENVNFTNVTSSSRVFAGSRFITIYFTSPPSMSYSVVGLGPNGYVLNNASYIQDTHVGDSVQVSGLQLEEISSFCQ
jgi:hypothetical protein